MKLNEFSLKDLKDAVPIFRKKDIQSARYRKKHSRRAASPAPEQTLASCFPLPEPISWNLAEWNTGTLGSPTASLKRHKARIASKIVRTTSQRITLSSSEDSLEDSEQDPIVTDMKRRKLNFEKKLSFKKEVPAPMSKSAVPISLEPISAKPVEAKNRETNEAIQLRERSFARSYENPDQRHDRVQIVSQQNERRYEEPTEEYRFEGSKFSEKLENDRSRGKQDFEVVRSSS